MLFPSVILTAVYERLRLLLTGKTDRLRGNRLGVCNWFRVTGDAKDKQRDGAPQLGLPSQEYCHATDTLW
jgi:hypothetical protein